MTVDRSRRSRLAMLVAASAAAVVAGSFAGTTPAYARTPEEAARMADQTLRQMTPEELTILTHGIMPLAFGPNTPPIPDDAIPGAGYIAGIPRLGVPALLETDASLGVSWVFGLRGDGATALPSGLAMASTWNPVLIEQGGAMIGAEARAKGFNVMLAGGANLMRDPRNGRNFEYLGEDPLLVGTLSGHAIRGIQSNHIIATIKHFALNGQETGRKFVDSLITPAAAHESDLLAFQIGIEIGQPGSVMCAYNRVNGDQACASDWLLNDVLKDQWRYPGFVMSDWGAVPGLSAALAGLDQQSGAQLDPAVFFSDRLAEAARTDPAYARRLQDMNRRVLHAIYQNELDLHPATPGGVIDARANAAIAEEVARQGIVLLRNRGGALPLAANAQRIVLIGGNANAGVIAGGGSSHVQGQGGPALSIPVGSAASPTPFEVQTYHRSSPLAAIRAAAPEATVTFRDGRYPSDAARQAAQADVAIVFATQWASEGFDQPDMTLPDNQDALIAAVAAANPNTIVVLETGGPVLMPWLENTAAVLEAWYPGARGGEAIAAVLFGTANPSGHLPITFPASEAQLPRAEVDGFATLEPDFGGNPPHADMHLSADYTVEGSDLGYRWNARQGHAALFPFGHGLSYTTFDHSSLWTDGRTARLTATNTGTRAGADVVQVYLLSRGGEVSRRLIGFARVDLAAGETRSVDLTFDQRLLADWQDGRWVMPAGDYVFAIGQDAETMGPSTTVRMRRRTWAD